MSVEYPSDFRASMSVIEVPLSTTILVFCLLYHMFNASYIIFSTLLVPFIGTLKTASQRDTKQTKDQFDTAALY